MTQLLQVYDPKFSHVATIYETVFRPSGFVSYKDSDHRYLYSTTSEPLEMALYTRVRTNAISYTIKKFYREPNKSDNPPGIGYNAKKEAGVRIPAKDYERRVSFFSRPWFRAVSKTESVQGRVSYVTYEYSGWIRPVNGHFPLLTDYFPPKEKYFFLKDASQAQKQATINLYGSLHKRKDIELGVLLAEAKESLGTIAKGIYTLSRVIYALYAGRAGDAVKALKEHFGGSLKTRKKYLNRGKLNRLLIKQNKKPVRRSEYAANAWLELQFGWLPILSDIFKLIDIVEGSLGSEFQKSHLYFNGYGKTSKTYVDLPLEINPMVNDQWKLFDFELGEDPGNTRLTPYFTGTVVHKYAYNACFTVSNSYLSILAQLGLINPLSIAWEKVPLSFVFDWFLPVGRWIDHISADAGLQLIQLSSSEKFDVEGMVFRSWQRYSTDWNADSTTDVQPYIKRESGLVTSTVKQAWFTRRAEVADVLPPMPLPELQISEVLDLGKLVTALALLRRFA